VPEAAAHRAASIAADNTLWSGDVADPANTKPDTVALREFNDALHRDERVTSRCCPWATASRSRASASAIPPPAASRAGT
jgi:predicted O-methyltransferase YrrM